MTEIDLERLSELSSSVSEETLREAAKRKMTPAERQRQMISFMTGFFKLNSPVTRQDVEKYVYERYGKVPD